MINLSPVVIHCIDFYSICPRSEQKFFSLVKNYQFSSEQCKSSFSLLVIMIIILFLIYLGKQWIERSCSWSRPTGKMSSQQSQSQTLSQPQTHTDFLVGIATENASLKVQIKQEYDNSCGMFLIVSRNLQWRWIFPLLLIFFNEYICAQQSYIRLINRFAKLIRANGIWTNSESYKRQNFQNWKGWKLTLTGKHLFSFREMSFTRIVYKLKFDRSSYETRERIKNNFDHLKKENDQILLEEVQKQINRVSICSNYEQMVQNQMVNTVIFDEIYFHSIWISLDAGRIFLLGNQFLASICDEERFYA